MLLLLFVCCLFFQKRNRNLHDLPPPPDRYSELSTLSYQNPAAAKADTKALEADAESPLETTANDYESLDLKPHDDESSQAGSGDTTSQNDKVRRTGK